MYISLIKAYYQDKNNGRDYEAEYHKRFDSCTSLHLPFTIKNTTAFYISNNKINDLITKIILLNNQINNTFNELLKKITKRYFIKVLDKEFMIQDIVSTNDIENIHSTRKDIENVINTISDTSDKVVRFSGLVSLYLNIINSDSDEEIINNLTCNKIRKYYDELLSSDINLNDKPDGELFRKKEVFVTNGLKAIHEGIRGEENIINSLNILLNFLKDKNEISILVKLAIFHYYFSYIHPFYDGNGRLNRFLTSLMMTTILNKYVCLSLSTAINAKKRAYYKIFDDTNNALNKGDLTLFIEQFLEFILDACKNIKEDFDERYLRLEHYHNLLSEINKNNKLDPKTNNIIFVLIQNALFTSDGLSKKEISEITGIGEQTIKNRLDQIVELGFKIFSIRNGNGILYKIDLDSIDELVLKNN